MNILKSHNIKLKGKTPLGKEVRLRPMTEEDWDILFKWNNDPEVLYYSEGDKVTSFTLKEIQKIYRNISQDAYFFIIEVDGKPVGECWLQKMNLKRILESYKGMDLRRIDLMIGEKEYWGKGIGTEAIPLDHLNSKD
jgi:RimJ/RimL family protein N-acetyltransferase